MSTTNAAIALSIGAVLGAGWVKTFSSGKKNLLDFRGLFSNLDKQIKDVSISGEKYFQLLDQKSKLKDLQSGLKETRAAFSSVSDIVKASVVSFAGYFGALTAATSSVSDWGDSMAKSAQRLNLFDSAGVENIEQLQRMQWAALQANIENEEFTTALDKMNQVIGQASLNGGEVAKTFQRLGISASALSKMGADKQLEIIVKKLESVSSASERARIVQEIWGRGAMGMQNLVAGGWGKLSKDMSAADDYIVHGNAEIVKSCGDWDTAFKQLKMSALSLWREGVMQFMPAITDAFKTLIEKIKENRANIQDFFQNFAQITQNVIPTVLSITSSVAGFAAALAGCSGFAKTLFYVLSTLGLLLFSYRTITASIVAITSAWKIATGLLTVAQIAFNVALSANPLALIVVAVLALAAIVYFNFDAIKSFVLSVFDAIVNFFMQAFDIIKSGVLAYVGFWVNIFNKIFSFSLFIVSKIKNAFASIGGAIKGALLSAWEWIKGTFWTLVENHPIFKVFKWVKGKFFSGSEMPESEDVAAAKIPLSDTDLENMSRDAVGNVSTKSIDSRVFDNHSTFNITQRPGEDSEALAERISARLAESYGNTAAAAL